MANPNQKQVKRPTKSQPKKPVKKQAKKPTSKSSNIKKMSPQKRQAYLKRKKQVERNRKILGISVAALLAVVLAFFLLFRVAFKIKTITVTGKTSYEETQIINASGASKGDSLLGLKEEKAVNSIKKNLPYISSVTIKKKLPSTLIIEAKETKPFMAVDTTSGTAMVDKKGKVLEFASTDKFKGKITKLEAGTSFNAELGETIFETNTSEKLKKEQIDKAKALKTVFDAINASGLKDLTLVNIKSLNNITMMYQNRLKLNIGTMSEIDYKLKAAAKIIEKENKAAPTEKGEIFLANTKNIYVSPEGN